MPIYIYMTLIHIYIIYKYNIYISTIYITRSLVLLFLHTFMCSPDEGPRRTEMSHLSIKSLELKCHVHIFLLFVLLYSNTRDAYLFVAIHFIYICNLYMQYIYDIYINK